MCQGRVPMAGIFLSCIGRCSNSGTAMTLIEYGATISSRSHDSLDKIHFSAWPTTMMPVTPMMFHGKGWLLQAGLLFRITRNGDRFADLSLVILNDSTFEPLFTKLDTRSDSIIARSRMVSCNHPMNSSSRWAPTVFQIVCR